MYEIFEKLCDKTGVTPYRVCKETGITTATISNWKAGRYVPKADKLQKIAEYFGVSLSFLLTGNEVDEKKETARSPKDEYEIGYDLDKIREKLEKDVNGPFYYKGKPLDDESIELLVKTLEIGLAHLERDTKKK